MARYIIRGGNTLEGDLNIPGGKNAVLPILAATVLSGKESVIHNCPKILDVVAMVEMLEYIGCNVVWEDDVLTVDSSKINKYDIPYEMTNKMRSSIILLGSLLGRVGSAKISYPGGCPLGKRPIDLHLEALRKMGADIIETDQGLESFDSKLIGAKILLRFPSVGATQNIILAGVLAKGTTTIYNPAKEPEILDLQNFLNKMGANIVGAGSNKIMIEGVDKLNNVEYKVMPDRIIAGTYMIASATNQGVVTLNNIEPFYLDSVILELRKTGCQIAKEKSKIQIKAPKTLKAIPMIKTEPYPGFPTDMQAQMMTLLSISDGSSRIYESVFEDRYKHVNELVKLGASIKVYNTVSVITGVKNLKGAKVESMDLRGGAALVLAGLIANGETIVTNISHIQRGYGNLVSDLQSVGANIHTEN